ncbi:hypothetical protein DsansV1_C29g0212341 [Dioscorea sansibarensis]
MCQLDTPDTHFRSSNNVERICSLLGEFTLIYYITNYRQFINLVYLLQITSFMFVQIEYAHHPPPAYNLTI